MWEDIKELWENCFSGFNWFGKIILFPLIILFFFGGVLTILVIKD